jgi:multidrug efflux pump subunit AcrA (membrane-fusion protein)
VRLRASFDNPGGSLRPGMFANVDVAGSKATEQLVVPATAVIFAPYGDSVYAVETKTDAPGKTAERASALRCAEFRLAASDDPWCLTWPPTATGRQPTSPRPGPCPAPVSPDVTKSLGLRHRAVSRSHPSNSVPP